MWDGKVNSVWEGKVNSVWEGNQPGKLTSAFLTVFYSSRQFSQLDKRTAL